MSSTFSTTLLFCALIAISNGYIRVQPAVSSTAGQTACQTKHSNLATIANDDDLAAAGTICARNFPSPAPTPPGCWTGLFRDETDVWEWIDTSNIGYGFVGGLPDNNGNPSGDTTKPWLDTNAIPPTGKVCVILDQTDAEHRWITDDCDTTNAFPLCNLRKHVFLSNSDCSSTYNCSMYNTAFWGAWPDYKEPIYWTNGVVVALTGALGWQIDTVYMGTSGGRVILTIDNEVDRPYFDETFSVTNKNGIDCVIKVNHLNGEVTLESWSVPIVYVDTLINPGNSWYVWDVSQVGGDNPTDKPLFIQIDNQPADGTNGATLVSYSWVNFDGIVWVSQASGLADVKVDIGAQAVYVKPQPMQLKDNEPKNVPIEYKRKLYKWNVKDDSFFVISVLIMGCAIFGLCIA